MIKGTRSRKDRGTLFSYPTNITQVTNGKLIHRRQNVCVSGISKAIQDNREVVMKGDM